MGLIIPLSHSVGTFPALKHSLKRICKTDIELSFLNTSEGILSNPLVLCAFASQTAF